MGFLSFTVTAAEFQVGRCSLRNPSSFIAVTTHVPDLKEPGAGGAAHSAVARAPTPGCQLWVCVVTTGMVPPNPTHFP